VPLLILTGLPIHSAMASVRPAAAILELASAVRFYKEKKITKELFKRGVLLGILAAIGAFAGVRLVVSTNEQNLRLIVSFVIMFMFVLLLNKNKWGMKEKTIDSKHILPLTLATLIIGIYGGYFGFAFGTVITLPLLIVGFTYLQSAVIGRLAGFMMSGTATVMFMQEGLIYFPHAIALAIGYAIGGWVGAGIGSKKGNPYIKKLLTMIIVISVIKLLIDFATAI